jgi:aspartyl aminopeptidase
MNESCTAYHAVHAAKERLLAAGFQEINEMNNWEINKGGKYFFVRNGTCLIGFVIGAKYEAGNGFTVIGAHTDSPCLRIKPVHCSVKGDALVLNTQPYGGGLWHTWFDRDLGIAGRIIYRTQEGNLSSKLVRINRAIARIPNLAIHLQSASERESFGPNLHEHAKAILTMNPDLVSEKSNGLESPFNPCLVSLIANECNVDAKDIVDMELQLIDLQQSCFGGASVINSGRLDNLCSSYQSTRALIDVAPISLNVNSPMSANVQMIMLFDHEEVGSNSASGAGSSVFMDTLRQIDANLSLAGGNHHTLPQALRKSYIVSIDMAHAQHPNYPAKHDPCMAPKINKGLVIKHNCNQRYATSSVSATMFREFAKIERLQMQEFAVRADAACGR